MQAITVKYLGPTNFRGARLKAACNRGSTTIPYPHEKHGDAAYWVAAENLIKKFIKEDHEKYGTPEDENPWRGPWVCGSKGGDETVFVRYWMEQYTFEVEKD